MATDDTDLTAVMDGPYTHGYFTSCGCGWTSTEQKRPGQATTELTKHRRDHHAPRPKEKNT